MYVMSVSKTTNSGTSWERYNIGTASGMAYALAMHPTNSNVVYAGGYENSLSAIYRTTNGGTDWVKLAATGLSGYVYALAINPDNPDIMFAGTSGNLYKSTDGGSTWATTGFTGSTTRALCFDPTSADASTIYAGTSNYGVYKSTNGGSNWTQMNDGFKELTIRSLDIAPNYYLFAGTEGGSAYRWDLQIGVEEHRDIVKEPVFFATPNPARGATAIHYQLSRELPVILALYDIQGRLVRVLVSRVQSAGTHRIHWNGLDEKNRQVASGVYLLKLTIENTTCIRKLVYLR